MDKIFYVKIIKCSHDKDYSYKNWIGHILNVKLVDTINYMWTDNHNTHHIIYKDDCEIINFDDVKISEETGRIMLNEISGNGVAPIKEKDIEHCLRQWKRIGIIRQSREDKIKEELNNLRNKYEKDYKNKYDSYENLIMILSNIKNKQNELLEIYEEQIKELKK